MVSPETYSDRHIAQLLGIDLRSSSSGEGSLLPSVAFSIFVELLVLLLEAIDSKD